MGLTRVSSIVSELPSDNYLINGQFEFNQRAASIYSASQYCMDRWLFQISGAAGCTIQQFTLTSKPYNNPSVAALIVVANQSGVSDYAQIRQSIEDVRVFAGKALTISFDVWPTINGNIGLRIENNYGTGGSTGESVIGTKQPVTSNQWNHVKLTVDNVDQSGKTISTYDSHLDLITMFSAGTNWNAVSDSLGIQNGNFYITNMKLEINSIDTPFVKRLSQLELLLCQAFYQKSYDYSILPGTVTNLGITRTVHPFQTNVITGLTFPIKMRTTPSITIYSPISGASGNVRDNSAGVDRAVTGLFYTTEYNFGYMALSTNIPAGYVTWYHWTADAEI